MCIELCGLFTKVWVSPDAQLGLRCSMLAEFQTGSGDPVTLDQTGAGDPVALVEMGAGGPVTLDQSCWAKSLSKWVNEPGFRPALVGLRRM